MKSNNVRYMYIMKGIGICLVVVAHSKAPFTNFINLFHMPLFFFISGYFYKDSYDKNLKDYILKKVKSLYSPFVIYSLMFLVFHNLMFRFNIYSEKISYGGYTQHIYNSKEFIKEFINIITFGSTEQLTGTFWFFTSLFTVSIVFCILRGLLTYSKNQVIFSIIIFLCFLIGYYTDLPRNISTSLIALSMYYLGYLYKKFEHRISVNYLVAIVSFIFLVFASSLGHISMVNNTYKSPIFLILCSTTGIYVSIYISQLIDRVIKSSWIVYIGQNTIIIMVLHFLAFKIVTLIQVIIYNEPLYMLAKFPVLYSGKWWWILYSLIGIGLPLILSNIIVSIKKCKIFNN